MIPLNTSFCIARAFEIARSGTISDVERIKALLSREGFDQHQIFGRALYKQLNATMRAARAKETCVQ